MRSVRISHTSSVNEHPDKCVSQHEPALAREETMQASVVAPILGNPVRNSKFGHRNGDMSH
jgi:hypothetical protein